MIRKLLLFILIGTSAQTAFAQQFNITPSLRRIGPSETATFAATTGSGAISVTWSFTSLTGATLPMLVPGGSGSAESYSLTLVDSADIPAGLPVLISATNGTVSRTAILMLEREPQVRRGGDIASAVIGFEQAGASSANSAQKFFFDFFISRPLGEAGGEFGAPLRWWGDVRIASYPQQIQTPIAQFASQFSTQIGQLPVNKVAQFGEFRTGLDFRLKGFSRAYLPKVGADGERSFVSVFAGFGALGPLNAPRENIQIFSVPAAGTPQAAAFLRTFPLAHNPDLALPATKYVGISIPDRDRFYWQYAGGLRLTTRFYDGEDELLPSPAMVAVSFGRHELVSGGDLKSWIGKFEGFYPLALGSRGSRPLVLYLFGRANLRFTRAIESTPLILSQAPGDVKADNPGVAIISQPSRRDMYTLGVGIDAVQLIKSIGKN